MTYSHQGVIKDLAPYLSYITQHYGDQVSVKTAIHLAGRIRLSIVNLQVKDLPFKDKDVYDQVITQYLAD